MAAPKASKGSKETRHIKLLAQGTYIMNISTITTVIIIIIPIINIIALLPASGSHTHHGEGGVCVLVSGLRFKQDRAPRLVPLSRGGASMPGLGADGSQGGEGLRASAERPLSLP